MPRASRTYQGYSNNPSRRTYRNPISFKPNVDAEFAHLLSSPTPFIRSRAPSPDIDEFDIFPLVEIREVVKTVQQSSGLKPLHPSTFASPSNLSFPSRCYARRTGPLCKLRKAL